MTPSAISAIHGLYRRRARSGFYFVSAECPVLESHKPGSAPGKAYVGSQLALKHLAGKEQLLPFFLVADAVADYRASHGSGQLGDEIAHLVGVRHEHQLWLPGRKELLERGGERVGRVALQLRGFYGIHLGQFLAGNFVRETCDAAAEHRSFEGPACLRG